MVREPYKPMFWTLSTTPMTEDQANRMVQVIQAECPGVFALAVDPAIHFRLYISRWDAELLQDALEALRAHGGDPGGLLEDVSAWLENQAEPYPEDAEPNEKYQPVMT